MLNGLEAVAQALYDHVNHIGADGLVGCRQAECRVFAAPDEAKAEAGRMVCPWGVSEDAATVPEAPALRPRYAAGEAGASATARRSEGAEVTTSWGRQW